MIIESLRKRLIGQVQLYLEKNASFNENGKNKSPAVFQDKITQVTLYIPKNRDFGDLSTNAALVLAPVLKKNPMLIAQDLKNSVISAWTEADNISVAAPGFINFFISRDFIIKNIENVAIQKKGYGCNKHGGKSRVQVEFVSANPTGSLHIGHGRWASLGDSLSNIFAANGFDVCREYYINDFGSQIEKFSLCLASLYLRAFGLKTEYPQDGYPEDIIRSVADSILQEEKIPGSSSYKGTYIKNRQNIIKANSNSGSGEYSDEPDNNLSAQGNKNPKNSGNYFESAAGCAGLPKIDCLADTGAIGRRGIDIMIKRITATLRSMNVEFDEWFYESSLYKESNFEKTVRELEKKEVIYKKENALWFKAGMYGDEKDRVVIRSGGEPTYFASDIMYLINKAARGFDRLIYILGADHHGYVKRLHAIANATGFDQNNIEVIIGQLVRLVEKGQPVKMSKRKGNVYMLDDLIEEVGSDAVRYFFSANSFDTPMDFDLDLAKQKSNQNPVYYVQYAHARIANIIDKVRQALAAGRLVYDKKELILPDKWSDDFEDVFSYLISENSFRNLDLKSNEEAELARTLILYPDAVYDACVNRAPYMINQYLFRLAAQFHFFYRHHRVIDEEKLKTGRFKLVLLIKIVLSNALKMLGVGAPEKM